MQKRKLFYFVVSIFAVSVLVSSCQQLDGPGPAGERGAAQEKMSTGPPGIVDNVNASADQGSIPDIVSRVSPCVVGIISNYSGSQNTSLGTGIIVEPSGYILTNNHVTEGADDLEIVFQDGRTESGRLLWSDAAIDLAVVKADKGPYPAASMGNTQNCRVGDAVVAIGTPLTLKFQHTVTSGIISALNRTLSVPSEGGESYAFMEDLIQTDVAINPGNSGGPLLDMRGEVIGINTLKVQEAEGLSFAIPIDICIPIVQHIVADEMYATPYLGVLVIDSEIAAYLGNDITEGLCVMGVDRNSPAYESGLREDDCITMINGEPMNTVLDLRKQTYAAGAGAQIEIVYKRGDESLTTACTLAAMPG